MQNLEFPPFLLDVAAERLWRGQQMVTLRPKSVAVLRYLIEHREQTVPHAELRRAVWSDVVVSADVLKVCIQEIRAALGDNAAAPRFIATIPRRGYRFIAPLTTPSSVPSSEFRVSSSFSFPTPNPQHLAPPLVGRDAELAQLHERLQRAQSGERQVVFVTGEPGIGKTTLVDTFLQRLESRVQNLESENQPPLLSEVRTLDPRRQTLDTSLWIARGQCLEHYGPSEAYAPLLEALERLGREPGRESLVSLLNQYAPTCLAQMPTLQHGADAGRLQHDILSATPERMLREMATAIEMLTAAPTQKTAPLLILVVEDLQWSDYSTLDFLSSLAQRRGTARLLLIGTYRPADVLVATHPLRAVAQELRRYLHCHELPLEGLSEDAVRNYLLARFPREIANSENRLQPLAHALYQRTEGHPLFLVSLVDDLVAHGMFVQGTEATPLLAQPETITERIPESLRESISVRLERLPREEQQLLETASVAGGEFSVAVVASALHADLIDTEDHCARLARQQFFLRPVDPATWPDGTVTARYRFRHALQQNVLYDRVPAARRAQLHLSIGERLERGHDSESSHISGTLARHFELGNDSRRAVRYLGHAAENAMHKHAYRETIDILTHALGLLQSWPETPERMQQELPLQITLGVALLMTRGFTAPEVEAVYARAHALCQQLGDSPQLFPVLEGLQTFYAVRGELPTAHVLAEQMFALAQHTQEPGLLLEAHHVIGDSLLMQAEFTQAHTHLAKAVRIYDSQQHGHHAFLYSGHDPGVCCGGYLGFVLWDLGYPEQALEQSHRAIAIAQAIAHPYSYAMSLFHNAYLYYLLRNSAQAQQQAEAAMALAVEHSFPDWTVTSMIVRGWALAMQGQAMEGLEQIRQGMGACQAIGIRLGWSGMAYQLAEACGKAEQHDEGLRVVDEALQKIPYDGERCYETELYRLKGALTLQQESQKSKGKSQKSKIGAGDWGLGAGSSSPQAPSLKPQASGEVEQEAEACFFKAIEIARQQQAKSLELRATTALARLWHQQGKHHNAHTTLATLYNWFTEGFATADLQEARELLDSLKGTTGRKNKSVSRRGVG